MSEDHRSEEIELLQAMYSQDGEFAASPDDQFSFTLRLATDPSHLFLEVSLPEGYPAVSPACRVVCDSISRDGIDELMRGLLAALEPHIGEICINVATDWLKDNAPSRMVAVVEAQEDSKQATDTEKPRKGLRRGSRCVMWEERGDLFEVGSEWCLCHCVSKDLSMSAGIAVDFKKNFGGVQDLKSQNLDVGGVGVLQKKGRYIYYLVTKNKHGGKPSMQTLEASLRKMREHMVANGVNKLAMPHIGCGLDQLCWAAVQELVLQVFDGDDVELLARSI
eukprot:TRINITY_DN6308_c0_g1_i1.p1 TRINITY_DN6308_c0_g1~~TRINITY_DN6308_c0_g1_i1.p1  ORF type:complete len:278 (-),score=39.58 TRINITY_DN6308_c0_g1_i1:52-885(-)